MLLLLVYFSPQSLLVWEHPHSSTAPSSVQSATFHHTHLTRPQLFLRHTAQQRALSPISLSLSVTPVSVPGSKQGTIFYHGTSTRSNRSSSHAYQNHKLTNGRTEWTAEICIKEATFPGRNQSMLTFRRRIKENQPAPIHREKTASSYTSRSNWLAVHQGGVICLRPPKGVRLSVTIQKEVTWFDA